MKDYLLTGLLAILLGLTLIELLDIQSKLIDIDEIVHKIYDSHLVIVGHR